MTTEYRSGDRVWASPAGAARTNGGRARSPIQWESIKLPAWLTGLIGGVAIIILWWMVATLYVDIDRRAAHPDAARSRHELHRQRLGVLLAQLLGDARRGGHRVRVGQRHRARSSPGSSW